MARARPAPSPHGQQAEYHIELGIDYGTTFTKISSRLVMNGTPLNDPIMLELSTKADVRTPSSVAFHNGEFSWGFDVARKVKEGSLPCEAVIQCAKLALYAKSSVGDNSPIVERVLQQLSEAGRSLDDLLNAHLSAIIAAARSRIAQKSVYSPKYSENFLRTLAVRARVSLPHDCPPESRQKMLDACRTAGVEKTQLVSEPICTFAAYLDSLQPHTRADRDSALRDGDTYIIADLGGGTADCVKFEQQGATGSNAKYRAVNKAIGSPMGSQHINEGILARVVEAINDDQVLHPGGMLAIQYSLGLTETRLRYHMLKEIETAKLQYTDFNSDKKYAAIYVENRGIGQDFFYKIPGYIIDAALDEVVDRIVLQLHDMVDQEPRSRFLLLAGGLGKCEYLRKKLEDAFERGDAAMSVKVISLSTFDHGDSVLVARGALSDRYDQNIDATHLPLEYGYGMQWDEEVDHVTMLNRHIDCTKKSRSLETVVDDRKIKPMTQGRFPPKNMTIHQLRKWKDDTQIPLWVLDRLQILFSPGEQARGGKTLNQTLVFLLEVEYPEVCVKFVYFKNPSLKAGAPTLVDNHDCSNYDNALRDGIMPWTRVSASLNKAKLASMDLEEFEDEGVWYWRVYGKVSITCNTEHDMEVGFELSNGKDTETWRVPGVHKAWSSHLAWDGENDAQAVREIKEQPNKRRRRN